MRINQPGNAGLFYESLKIMNANSNSNALVTVDSLDAGAEAISPVKGPRIWFDTNIFYVGEKTKQAAKDAQYFVTGLAEGWQKLEAGQPATYIMRTPGKASPAKPDVPESEWPNDLSGKPTHPFRWTRYLFLLSVASGVTSTFTTNTVGGRIAIDELLSQVQAMRAMKPGALPIVTLESQLFKTQFGMKPRPHFAIQGWRGSGAEAIGRDDPEQIEHFDDPIDDIGD